MPRNLYQLIENSSFCITILRYPVAMEWINKNQTYRSATTALMTFRRYALNQQYFFENMPPTMAFSVTYEAM